MLVKVSALLLTLIFFVINMSTWHISEAAHREKIKFKVFLELKSSHVFQRSSVQVDFHDVYIVLTGTFFITDVIIITERKVILRVQCSGNMLEMKWKRLNFAQLYCIVNSVLIRRV